MGIKERAPLYSALEEKRGRPLLVYVTSSRVNAHAAIAADVVPEFLDQLKALPDDCDALDLLLVSNGGDPTVAWRVVSLIRERVSHFSVLIPQAAYSAATLIALGADEIVMHPHGNLGPTDPQITVSRRNQGNGQTDRIPFGSEDLGAFMKYAKETVGLTDQAQLKEVFLKFCDEVGTVGIGVAARSAQLGVTMGEKLLQLHMGNDGAQQKARAISEKLTRDYFHHGYPLSRSEAVDIGLKVANNDDQVLDLMWAIWADISAEMELRSAFNPMRLITLDPNCAWILTPPPANNPNNNPVAMPLVATTRFKLVQVVLESARLASRYVMAGTVVAVRNQPFNFQTNVVPDEQEWRTVWPGTADSSNAGPSARLPRKPTRGTPAKTAAKRKPAKKRSA